MDRRSFSGVGELSVCASHQFLTLRDDGSVPLTGGVRVSITARRPCWLGVYWGTAIAEMYPIIHRPWLEMRDIPSSSALMSSISVHHEDLHMFPLFSVDFDFSVHRMFTASQQMCIIV